MKKKLLFFALAAAVAVTAAALPAMAKDRLIVGDEYDITSMDPIGHSDAPSSRVCFALYDTLIFRTADGDIVPGLAESWKTLSPTEYEFHLRKGVKFHNGDEMKASDVQFSIMRATTEKGAKIRSYSQDVKDVRVVDDYTCVIELKAPNSGFFNTLPHHWASILSKRAVEEAGDDYGTLAKPPVGTGPFKFVSWDKNNKYVLERFDDYWGPKPGFKYLEVRSIPETSNRTIELETGGVDIAYPISVNDMKRISDNPELTLIQKPSNSITYLGFNTVKAPFNDVRARRAVKAAIDILGMHKAVFERLGRNGNVPRTIIPVKIPYSIHDQMPDPVRDIELAKKLLKEAGVPEGTTVELWTNQRKERMDMAQIIMAELEEVGLKVSIKVLEWGAYLSGLQEKTHDMFILGWTNPVPDANFSMAPLLETGSGANYAYYSNPELDKLFVEGRRTPDGPERAEIYKKAQQIFNDEVPMITLHNEDHSVGLRKSVKGFEVGSTYVYSFRNVSFDE
jgi:peptide/nickel transport system substrate-binding protein